MRNIIIVGLVFWMLFMNGLSYIQSITKSPPEAIEKIQKGVERIIPTTQIVIKRMPELPTATPKPIQVVTSYPKVTPPEAQLADASCDRCSQIEPQGDPRYESSDGGDGEIDWAMHAIPAPDGQFQDCLYMYDLMKQVCWAPGSHPSPEMIQQTIKDVTDGVIPGQPLKSYG